MLLMYQDQMILNNLIIYEVRVLVALSCYFLSCSAYVILGSCSISTNIGSMTSISITRALVSSCSCSVPHIHLLSYSNHILSTSTHQSPSSTPTLSYPYPHSPTVFFVPSIFAFRYINFIFLQSQPLSYNSIAQLYLPNICLFTFVVIFLGYYSQFHLYIHLIFVICWSIQMQLLLIFLIFSSALLITLTFNQLTFIFFITNVHFGFLMF